MKKSISRLLVTAVWLGTVSLACGEEVVHELADAFLDWREAGGTREELLVRLAQIDGVYVPSLYEERTLEGDGVGRKAAGEPINPAAPERIVRRIVEDHGGSVRAGATTAGGARFEIEWPGAGEEENDG